MTDLITADEATKLLDGATPGPWEADGDPWNRIIWSSAENRVCFMAHSNGLDDARDIATSNLIAAAPDLARTVIALHAQLADAQAAVALVVAELRQFVTDSYQCGCMDAGCAGRHAERNSTLEALSETLDALAPADGLALVRELRAERDAADQRAGAMLARIVALEADGEAARSAASTNFARAETAEAERDRLAAANAVLEAKVAGLDEHRASAMLRRDMNAPEDPHVEALCERYGYGAVMDAASRLWARKDSMGAFYIGGCIGMKTDREARAALATQEAGTC